MKKLMLTTAIVAITSMGAVAQTADTTGQTTMNQGSAGEAGERNVPAFLATDFTGKNLYTVDVEEARNLREERMTQERGSWERTSMRWESDATFSASRDRWEDVGSIGDVVMTQDGEVRGILIDVGGFLGLGARTVMVDIDELYFVADDSNPEDLGDFFVVAALTESELEGLPEWNDDQLSIGFESRRYSDMSRDAQLARGEGDVTEQASMEQSGDDTMATQPAEGSAMTDTTQESASDQTLARTTVPEGYMVMERDARTAENLIGANVYGRQGEDVGSVDDLVLAEDGSVTHAIIDVGGFLGLGTHTVALELDAVDILWNDQDGDVRVQLPMTQEELESLPEYEG
ncbi:PRC-barrel domain-containing protein [Pararhodobacter sp. SW119]|uniref:PRC-barrel domain-containing protein n=1 Tax=Pararhodobacter sp. SW119 TaxID=2780075 RepID=UPI001AE068BA|nr:PRC-barrel domain-containing protein [Pararhodobacter sp. SW119]